VINVDGSGMRRLIPPSGLDPFAMGENGGAAVVARALTRYQAYSARPTNAATAVPTASIGLAPAETS
jgi:hypothetical protein